jgi:hypothetical protein
MMTITANRTPLAAICLAIALLLLLPAGPASAQFRGQFGNLPPRPDPVIACREVVINLMTALDKGDPDALRACIYADRRITAQQLGLTALIDCIVAQRELERAIVTRFGASVTGAVAGQSFFSPTDRTQIDDARVELNNEHEAMLLLSSGVAPITLRYSRFEGRWRVVLGTLSSLYDGFERTPEPGSLKRIGYLRTVAAALHQVAQQLSAGKFASPDAVRAALQKMLEAGTRTSLPRPSPEPG